MKKIALLISSALLFVSILVSGQSSRELRKILELKIPREGGANAASVAWHPVQKKYYAAMAGNVSFCMGVFDISGKLLSAPELSTLFDVRGLWYNPATGTLQMNGYNDFGWGEYILNAKGFPSDVTTLFSGLNQPDEQSVGAFDPREKLVYFFNEDGNIEKYDLKTGQYLEQIELHLGQTEEDVDFDNYDVFGDYNSTSIVFTGIPGAEIGVLNYTAKEIELYNIETGYKTRTLSLPGDAPAYQFLNFSYCNGIYWFFDKDTRIWKGYK
jgi:hypothetical protein